jgi:tetratricopeptide (TPR) repeat protein/predicted Ser/Thr protein kinase
MINTTINNRYKLISELGQGSMGVVYCAHDMALKRDVAIKVLSKSRLGTEGQARLLNEAQMVAKLNHPNIVTVYDVGEVESTPFIVMELVDGKNLHEQPPKDLEETIEITRQLCQALDHAHEKVVIHRDIKPENVVLTSSGVTKLMDFGLARSVVSRLTTEGTIVGTVSYLAPEQALGQVIDQRADLYSLGVMLYELTTGQLPFRADDPVAVISQHLHAPVVPPRVINPDIPPGLENLIIRLLRKEPADRPGSAAEVRQLLEKPDILDEDVGDKIEPNLLDRIVRGQIVGRQRELQNARNLWEKAQSGEGQNLLISGEPGIGKTRLMREMVSQAEVSGGQALIGVCFPEGNGPYEAFGQVIRQAFRRNDDLQDDLPAFVMAELIALTPNLKITFPDVPDNPPLEAKAQQQRLLESVVTLCRALSARAPLLLVVEDLHWADGGTLTLFRHMARRTRRQRIMLLGTYREVELDQTLPFHQVLSDLNRERLAARLKLGRLSREQTGEMLTTLFSQETTPEFLDGIFLETEGNPFFIEEVCKALLESGKLHFDGIRWHRPDIKDLEIPQSVRVAVQSRVGKLPEQVQETLTLAAILGREFDFDALMESSGLNEDTLIENLESAERAQLIEEISSEHGGTFTFSHAIISTTLTRGLSGLKKRRLHQQVAAMLENLRPDKFNILAYHYLQAEVEDKALTYLTKAGDRARQTYANQDAVRYYTQALEILPEEELRARFDLLDARAAVYDAMTARDEQLADAQALLDLAETLKDDILRCKALLALAEHYRLAEFTHTLELASQALDIASSLGDPILEARSLMLAGMTNWWLGRFHVMPKMLGKAAERYQQEGSLAEAARCLHTLAVAYYGLADYPAALKAAKEAVKLSRLAGSKRQEAIALRRVGIAYGEKNNYDQAISYTEKALDLSRQIGDLDSEMDALNNLGNYYSYQGNYEEAKRCYLASIQISEEVGSVTLAVYNYLYKYTAPLGQLEKGLRFLRDCLDDARKGGNEVLAEHYSFWISFILFDLGQYVELIELLNERAEIPIFGVEGRYSDLTISGVSHYLIGQHEKGLKMIREACEQEKSLELTNKYAWAVIWMAFVQTYGDDPSVWLTALSKVKQVLPLFGGLYNEDSHVLALSTIARLYLLLGKMEEAMDPSAQAAAKIEERKLYGFREFCFLTHSRVLRAAGHDEEADDYLQKAYQRVMLVAGKTKDETLRQGWLENVPWNREILKEARERKIATYDLGNAGVT